MVVWKLTYKKWWLDFQDFWYIYHYLPTWMVDFWRVAASACALPSTPSIHFFTTKKTTKNFWDSPGQLRTRMPRQHLPNLRGGLSMRFPLPKTNGWNLKKSPGLKRKSHLPKLLHFWVHFVSFRMRYFLNIFWIYVVLCIWIIILHQPFTYSRTHPIDLGGEILLSMFFFETSLKYIIPTFGLDIYGKCDIPYMEHME